MKPSIALARFVASRAETKDHFTINSVCRKPFVLQNYYSTLGHALCLSQDCINIKGKVRRPICLALLQRRGIFL